MRRVLAILFVLLLALAAVLAGRALTLRSRQIAVAPAPPLAIDREAALQRFSRAIQFRTISYSDFPKPGDHDAFLLWLPAAYPRTHAAMRRELVGKSLLYTWQGSDLRLQPLLLMGHYDVVPVEPGTEKKWTYPPFDGVVADGFIWGRGTMDDKVTVMGLLEAAELLIAEGHRPARTILLAFGHDEEIGGNEGAKRTAALLAARGVRLHAVIDEGGAILAQAMAGLAAPAAVIGIAEKGFASVELRATGPGGHSSMPPRRTPVGAIAAAVDRVQQRPLPAEVRGATAQMLRWLSPELPFAQRLVMANTWLSTPLLDAATGSSATFNAMLRTTTAPTVIAGGVKDNVIPSEAHAIVNFRLLPGETSRSVLEHVRRAVDDDSIELHLRQPVQEPSPVSDPGAPQFAALQRSIEQVFPDTVVAPYLTVGGTDARHFHALTPHAYRFLPVRFANGDLQRFHGTDERIAIDNYFEAIRFYRTVMVNAGTGTLNTER